MDLHKVIHPEAYLDTILQGGEKVHKKGEEMKLEDVIFYAIGIITMLGAIAHTIFELVKERKENR